MYACMVCMHVCMHACMHAYMHKYIHQCRFDIRNDSFSQMTINEWNTLFADCVNANSVNMFENKIDKYLRKVGYT